MTHSPHNRGLYSIPNGDRWLLAREPESGHVFVRHIPNIPSVGKTTDIELVAFLCERSYGQSTTQQPLASDRRCCNGPGDRRPAVGAWAIWPFASGTVGFKQLSAFIDSQPAIRQRHLTPSCGGHAPTA